ncbi:MAG: hypothetical protein IK027_00485 [Deltaproteobacteria bacterium]|nr:hypothetical protein [Deltaproteobacteria bacterium]
MTLDDSSNTLKYKIRNAQMDKIPYMIILGDKDMEAKTVSVRTRTGDELGAMPLGDFEKIIEDVVHNKKAALK